MTKYNYAFKSSAENVVKTVGRDLALSRKQAIEICKYINGMTTEKAKAILEKVQDKKLAVPFTRATNGAGHRRGPMAAGKYPLKASMEFIKLMEQLEANAQSKGLSSNLKIIHACTQQAAEPFRQGRKGRVQMKRCHIEMAAVEADSKKHKAAEHKKDAKKETKQEQHKKE